MGIELHTKFRIVHATLSLLCIIILGVLGMFIIFFIVDNLGFQLDAPNSENRSVQAENTVWRKAPPTQHQIENPTLI